MKIYKSELQYGVNEFVYTEMIPRSVDLQNGRPCLWYQCVDDGKVVNKYAFQIFLTGEVCDLPKENYVGSFQYQSVIGVYFVGHVFQL